MVLQAYVVPEFCPRDAKGDRMKHVDQNGIPIDAMALVPRYTREAWVVFLYDGARLVDEYCFCHGFQAEQRAEACAHEWRTGAPWALRKAA